VIRFHVLVATATSGVAIGGHDGSGGPVVFLDADTVLLAVFPGKRGVELGLQADLDEAIGRLAEAADRIVVLVEPPPAENRAALKTTRRLDLVREGLGEVADGLLLVACPHGESDGGGASCQCAKPDDGLIQVAIEQHDLPRRGGWYVSADQEGVVAGRAAGLHTIRIGPSGVDHLSSVHRADYEARDLLDAANHILMEQFAR
jgi:hypothetical protein